MIKKYPLIRRFAHMNSNDLINYIALGSCGVLYNRPEVIPVTAPIMNTRKKRK